MRVHCRYIYFERTPTERSLWQNLKALKAPWALDENVSISMTVKWGKGLSVATVVKAGFVAPEVFSGGPKQNEEHSN